MWALTYFAFTTLSTVGFGDYHPRNNTERFIGAFLLLFGVMVNSFVMETLTKMIESLKKVSVEHEDYDMLAMFISTLKKFNENIDISQDQISQIT
jgi:hypothetical protein